MLRTPSPTQPLPAVSPPAITSIAISVSKLAFSAWVFAVTESLNLICVNVVFYTHLSYMNH